ncbi:MAG TPA: type II CAAX endopeptidase family protein [Thermosynechococcaceae cyanobacterium]
MTTDIANPFLKLKARTLLLWTFLLSLSMGFGLGLISAVTPLKTTDPLWAAILYVAIFGSLSLLSWRQLRQAGADPMNVLGKRSLSHPWWSIVGLVAALLSFSLGAFFVSFILLSFAAPDFVQSVLQGIAQQAKPESDFPVVFSGVNAVVLVIVAPLTEEFLFRGILLQRWATKWNPQTALIVSSIVFGLMHVNVIGLSLFGLAMGLLYFKTRTLLTPIVCHGLNNAAALGLGLLSTGDQKTTVTTLESLRSEWWVGLLLILVSAPFLLRLVVKNFPRQEAQAPYFINAIAKKVSKA